MKKKSCVFLTMAVFAMLVGFMDTEKSVVQNTVNADDVPLIINNRASYASENADAQNVPSYMRDFSVQYIRKGDINGDGVIDLTDLTLLSIWLVGDIELSYEQLVAADVVYDSYSQAEPDLADLATIKQIICKDNVSLEFNPDKMLFIAR